MTEGSIPRGQTDSEGDIVTYDSARRGSMPARIAELFLPSRMELVFALLKRDFKVRYQSSVLGYMWSFMQPMAQMLVYVVVFSFIVRLDVPNYPLFLLSGLLPWLMFSGAIKSAALSLTGNAYLIRKTSFPREALHLSAIGNHAVHFTISLLILAVVMAGYGVAPTANILYIVPLMLLGFMFILGIGMALSVMAVEYRDMEHIIDLGLMIGIYASPVLYPVEMVPERFEWLYRLNPMVWYLEFYRDILIYGRGPAVSTALVVALVSIGTGLLGYRYFIGAENRAMKEL